MDAAAVFGKEGLQPQMCQASSLCPYMFRRTHRISLNDDDFNKKTQIMSLQLCHRPMWSIKKSSLSQKNMVKLFSSKCETEMMQQ